MGLLADYIKDENLQYKLQPKIVYEHVNADNQWGSTSLIGDARYNWDSNEVYVNGTCVHNEPQKYHGKTRCYTNELFLDHKVSNLSSSNREENSNSPFSVRIGKTAFDTSVAILTSPMNPSISGLSLVSPLESQEGLWQSFIKYTPDTQWAWIFGAAYSFENTKKPDENINAFPYIRGRWFKDSFDTQIIGSSDFLGMNASWQIFLPLLIYTEYNNLEDFLLGFQLLSDTEYFSALKFTLEYNRNNFGIPGRASDERLLKAIDGKVKRMDVYHFPSPNEFLETLWGVSHFLSQNLLFIDLRQAGFSKGVYGSFLYSLDDFSYLTTAGYQIDNPWKFGTHENYIKIDLRHFEGLKNSEFGSVKFRNGENQLWVSFLF